MSEDHPYTKIRVPPNAPFELKPSPGKGWGAFATRLIKQGEIILREAPLFVIRGSSLVTKEKDIQEAFSRLPLAKQAEFNLLRENDETGPMALTYIKNRFLLHGDAGCGLFVLLSRFNHSCVPNSESSPGDAGGFLGIAKRDIAAGEEITLCYDERYDVLTRGERHRAMDFVCTCQLCSSDTYHSSDMRRRLIRGLGYLLCGVDACGFNFYPAIITDPALRNAAEQHEIPLSSRLVYSLMRSILMEKEGQCEKDSVQASNKANLLILVSWFRTPQNVQVAHRVAAQPTELEALLVAFTMFGMKDAGDDETSRKIRNSVKQLVNSTCRAFPWQYL